MIAMILHAIGMHHNLKKFRNFWKRLVYPFFGYFLCPGSCIPVIDLGEASNVRVFDRKFSPVPSIQTYVASN